MYPKTVLYQLQYPYQQYESLLGMRVVSLRFCLETKSETNQKPVVQLHQQMDL